jgi:hypothetical protein
VQLRVDHSVPTRAYGNGSTFDIAHVLPYPYGGPACPIAGAALSTGGWVPATTSVEVMGPSFNGQTYKASEAARGREIKRSHGWRDQEIAWLESSA